MTQTEPRLGGAPRVLGAGLLGAYLGLARGLGWLAPVVLKRRLARGKEDPARWREKLGEPGAARPAGPLVWLHGVGLGEVMALRALVWALHEQDPALEFLITSSTRVSAQVLAKSGLPRSRHQFMPLDSPVFLRRFLAHWRPDLVIWSEQDIWPAAIVEVARRGVAQAYVNARITPASLRQRQRLGALFGAVLDKMALVSAQDLASEARLRQLGARRFGAVTRLKPSAPALPVEGAALDALRGQLGGRRVLLGASTHEGDEREIMTALHSLDPADWLVVIAPRDVARAPAISRRLTEALRAHALRSEGLVAQTPVFLADSYGEMGLWYQLADVALIGGGFDSVGGHNPWEAVPFDTAILHGPDDSNFAEDYRALAACGAARQVAKGGLVAALPGPSDARAMARCARRARAKEAASLSALARALLALREAGR